MDKFYSLNSKNDVNNIYKRIKNKDKLHYSEIIIDANFQKEEALEICDDMLSLVVLKFKTFQWNRSKEHYNFIWFAS